MLSQARGTVGLGVGGACVQRPAHDLLGAQRLEDGEVVRGPARLVGGEDGAAQRRPARAEVRRALHADDLLSEQERMVLGWPKEANWPVQSCLGTRLRALTL